MWCSDGDGDVSCVRSLCATTNNELRMKMKRPKTLPTQQPIISTGFKPSSHHITSRHHIPSWLRHHIPPWMRHHTKNHLSHHGNMMKWRRVKRQTTKISNINVQARMRRWGWQIVRSRRRSRSGKNSMYVWWYHSHWLNLCDDFWPCCYHCCFLKIKCSPCFQ